MIEALLHGKLSREQENMEDLLTSAVFGRLKHLPAGVIASFLGRARTTTGATPLSTVSAAKHVAVSFWPTLRAPGCQSAEPDVVVEAELPEARQCHVVIEAKFRSGKSSFADDEDARSSDTDAPARDQLAREWENVSMLYGPHAWVVYLTADYAMPRKDLEDANAELLRNGKPRGNFCWLSWRALDGLAPATGVFGEVQALLERLQLRTFRSVTVPSRTKVSWRFAVPRWTMSHFESLRFLAWKYDALNVHRWKWDRCTPSLTWSFRNDRHN